jgi:single-stranded DNA-binding protein
MSAFALISGKLFRDPERKTSKAGKPYAMATIKDGQGEAANWWRVFAFGDEAADELLGLRSGDAVAVSGSFKADIYDKGGTSRISLSVVADRIISAKKQKREQAADRRAKPQSIPINRADAQRPLNDELPPW